MARVGVLIRRHARRGGPGEVHVKVRGGSESFIAWSDEPLPGGATVLVIESRGTRAVDVVEWPETRSATLREYRAISL